MRLDRLQQIADHLSHGQLAHEVFDFSVTNYGELKENGCGTNGCAIGEFPQIWPKLFYWDISGRIMLIENDIHYYSGELASKWLEITKDEARFLFYPEESGLGDHATKEQVADHIQQFINEHQ